MAKKLNYFCCILNIFFQMCVEQFLCCLPYLVGKTHRDHFLCYACGSNFHFDRFQSKLGHRCNMGICWWGQSHQAQLVIWGQVEDRQKCEKWPRLENWSMIGTKFGLGIHCGTLCMFMRSKIICHGQRSWEVKL